MKIIIIPVFAMACLSARAQSVYEYGRYGVPVQKSVDLLNRANAGRFYVALRGGIDFLDNKNTQWVVDDATDTRSYIASGGHFISDSPTIKFAAGFDANPVRVELEYGFSEKFSNAGIWKFLGGMNFDATWRSEHRIQTAFFNLFYDVKTRTNARPFFGAGIGYVNIHECGSIQIPDLADLNPAFEMYRNMAKIEREENLGFHMGGGISLALSSRASGEFGYRFYNLGGMRRRDYNAQGAQTEMIHRAFKMHEVMIGLRYKF